MVAMTIGIAMGVPIGGVVVQRIGFRLGQAKRGNGENYDLFENCLNISTDNNILSNSHHALHIVILVVVFGQVRSQTQVPELYRTES